MPAYPGRVVLRMFVFSIDFIFRVISFNASYFNNKGIKLTAKTVDEDIEKAGVASRNIVMTKAIHVVLISFVFGQEVFGLPVLVIFKAPKFAKGFFGVNFWSREFFGHYWLS